MTDTTDATVALTTYLERLAESTRIDVNIEAVVRGESRAGSSEDRKYRARSQIVGRAAVIVLLVGGVGLLAMFVRPESAQAPPSSADQTTLPVPRLFAPADVPAGFEPTIFEEDARSAYESAGLERIYSVPGDQLDDSPTVSVLAIDARLSEPQLDPTSTDVEVQNSPGSIWSPAVGQERVRFGPIDGTWYLVTGYALDRATLLALAETVVASPDGFGAVVDVSQAVAGLEEVAAGARYGTSFISRTGLDQPISHATWVGDSGSFEYFVSVGGDAPLSAGQVSAGRDVYDTLRDIRINGEQGVVATGENQGGSHTTIYWTTGQESIVLTSRNMSEEQVIELAESIRPTTSEDWPR